MDPALDKIGCTSQSNPPTIFGGSIYSCIEEFRVALSQHAIKHEFEYNIEKIDPERLRAYCTAKNKGCKWIIHTSVLEDRKTMKASIFLILVFVIFIYCFLTAPARIYVSCFMLL
jgi:hypothetical protein